MEEIKIPKEHYNDLTLNQMADLESTLESLQEATFDLSQPIQSELVEVEDLVHSEHPKLREYDYQRQERQSYPCSLVEDDDSK